MALNQIKLSDGFVNLWSFLEVESKDVDEKTKIDKVIKGVLPILQQELGEHLHIYCDCIILELIIKLASSENLLTFQDVSVDTRLLVR